MNSEKLGAFVRLTRPVNLLITAVSVPAACVLAGADWSDAVAVLLASLTAVFVAAGANAVNDVFDVEIDKVNRPDRPVASGILLPREALLFSFVLSGVGVVLNLALGVVPLLIALGSVVLLYYYSAYFKRTVIAGNVVVGMMTGLAFVYGAVVAGHAGRGVLPALFAFLINVAREVVKDMEDVEGDRKGNAQTLPVRYGMAPARMLASAVMALLIIVTLAAYVLGYYSRVYLWLVIPIDMILAFSIFSVGRDPSPASLRKVSTLLKACMAIGLIAIYLGS